MAFSPDLHVMARPARTYAAAMAASPPGRSAAIRRPALAALLIGAGTAVSSTGHLTLGLLISGVICWSFVPILQVMTAAAIMRPRGSQPIPLGRRLDLWFMGHAPWSVWIVAATCLLANAPGTWRVEWPLIATAIIPIVWTSIIAAAFCRVVLGDPPGVARARVALHQGITWTIAVIYVAYAVALWPRVVAFLGG
jgi:hypothetical protein